MSSNTKLYKAITLVLSGSTLALGMPQSVVASTTMYNLYNASIEPRVTDGPAYPHKGSQVWGTDGWLWGGVGNTSHDYTTTPPVANPYAADPGWLGTESNKTISTYSPFGTTTAMAVNWAAHITQSGDSLEISQTEAVTRFGTAMLQEFGEIYYPDIDTSGGAWDQKAPNERPHGARNSIDIGLFKSDVTQTINLNITGLTHPEDNFGITVYTGLSPEEYFYAHHGNFYGALQAPFAGMPYLTHTPQDPLTHLTSNSLSFTAEAGQIYTILLGGNNGDSWTGQYDSYVLNIQTSPVPLPGTAWLFGSILSGLAGVQRRKCLATKAKDSERHF